VPTNWKRYEELRPEQLAELTARVPVAYWPLGLLEHHGWHLPVGFDGIKAQRLCQRLAERTGGVLLPVMWWGWGGGHGDFRWTHYQQRDASCAIIHDTVGQLLNSGLRVIVLLAGHYPWQAILDQVMPPYRQSHPDALLLWGTEMNLGAPQVQISGDHAAREETSMGLELLPELVDTATPGRGRDKGAWPRTGAPDPDARHPGVCFDPDSPQFAQMGTDAREASAAHGADALAPLIDHVTAIIKSHLKTTA
jgi:creatinine amidohydrolase